MFVYHPTARGKRVLEAYPQARPFFEALAASQDGFVREAADVLGTGAENPWALVRKTGGGWWVVAELADGEAMASQRRVTLAVWGLMAVAVVLLAIGLFVMLRRGVSRPLQDLTQAITLVAQGDLTEAFHTTRRDEIGALVQEVEGMRQRYTQMLQQVRNAVDSITTASAEIASGNQDLSARTEATASSLAQTAQSMEHLTSTVRQSADAAQSLREQATRLAGAVQVFKLSRGDGSAGHGGLGYAPARPWPGPWRRPATAKGSTRPAAAPGRPPSCNRARHRCGWSSGGLRPVVLGLCWPDSFHTPAHLHLWPPTSPPCWQ